MGKYGVANKSYSYFLLDDWEHRVEEYMSYTDIALEYGVGKGSVAGKFYRAEKAGKNTIRIDNNRIEKVEKWLCPVKKKK